MTGRLQPAEFKPPRQRLQFSLQTMLALMLLAACLFGWLLTPKLKEKTLGGGAFIVRGQWAVPDAETKSSLWANATTPDAERPTYGGRWLLYDRYRRKLAEGYFQDNLPAGRWQYHDSQAGRVVLAGDVRQGSLEGPWTARHPDETVRQQVTYGQPEVESGKGGAIPFSSASEEPYPLAERSGKAKRFWADGQPRSRGSFHGDRRVGQWTFFDEQGHTTAAGPYRNGRRHGPWREGTSNSGEAETRLFLEGRRIDKPDALLARLADDLLSAEPLRQVRAARGLELFGARAVPALREALRDGTNPQQLLAIRVLKHLGPSAAAASDDLVAAGDDEHPRVRLLSLVALAEIDAERTKSIYGKLLAMAADEHPENRELVISCLAQAGPNGLRQLLDAPAADDDQDCPVAIAAMARMYEAYLCDGSAHGDPRINAGTLDAVFRLLENHPDERVSRRAEEVLQRGPEVPGRNLPSPFRIQGGII